MKQVFFIAMAFVLNVNYTNAQTFTLKSKDLGGQATSKQIFNDYGCTGENKSPQLFWENAPKDTKSFAVTIYDENAPTGSGWWHWVIFDIDSSNTELIENAGNLEKQLAPKNSIQSNTDFGLPGYGGPCPPADGTTHKYIITIYALKVKKLGLNTSANPAFVGFMLNQNTIEKASLIFYYKKQ
jgi:hypothetical protein